VDPAAQPQQALERYLEGIEEVFAIYDQVRAANASWIADTIENKRRVCELFTSDDLRISHRVDVNDMKNAATILSGSVAAVV
jgi:hypothetical protein